MFSAAATLLACFVPSLALNVPFRREITPRSTSIGFVSKSGSSNDSFNFQDVNQASGEVAIYVGSLSVSGHTFEVQLDTGSSDLWLDTSNFDTSGLENTGINSGLSYGDGTVAEGPVLIGNVTFGDFTVQQAFISAPKSNATTNGDSGLLGVGPPSLSAISDSLSGTQFNGKTLMENIFASNSSIPLYTTFQLSRSESSGTTDGGTFTIGEVNQTLSAVSQAPKLSVLENDRWVVFMDGIIVNGKTISGQSNFDAPGQTSAQTLANLDTGTSAGVILQDYLDAIYSDIPGAQFDSNAGVYIVDCSAKIDVSFIFGGVSIPIHPIDMLIAQKDSNGNIFCTSGFSAADGSDTSEDHLLGDSFLRNVYALFDYGSLISGSTDPFIQLLGTTDSSTADNEFSTLSSTRNASLSGKSSNGSTSSSGSLPRIEGLPVMLLTFVGAVAGLLAL